MTRAPAYVCGLGFYKLFVDGAKISTHEMGQFSTFSERAYYDTHDVTAALAGGVRPLGSPAGSGLGGRRLGPASGVAGWVRPRCSPAGSALVCRARAPVALSRQRRVLGAYGSPKRKNTAASRTNHSRKNPKWIGNITIPG